MNHFKKLGLGIALLAFVFSGCSSSGGGGGGNPPIKTTKISGTVSGTTIIAVNDNGDIVATDDTDGKTPDAQENFPFTLSDIPVGSNVRVFLITGAGIYPMYFDSDGDGNPDTNVFSSGSETEIDLGFVNTQVTGQIGRAIPQKNPTDIGSVVSAAVNEAIPESLFTPDTGELTLAQLLGKGLDAIKNQWLQGANTYLKKAVEVAGADTSNNADTARFLYAIVRIAAAPADIRSDGNPDDLNHLGDYLDQLGCDTSDTRRANAETWEGMCPEEERLPVNSPTGADYQSLAAGLVGQEIEGAITNLDAISTSFNWKPAFEGDSVEIDHSDVLVLRAGLKGALALIAIQDAYNVDVDLDEEDLAASNPGTNTPEAIRARNPMILMLKDPSKLAEAKALLIGGVNDTLAAITSIQNEGDEQSDDLVDLLGDEDDTPESMAIEIAEGQAALNMALDCLNGTKDCVDDQNDLDPKDDVKFTLQPLFTGAVNFNQLLPSFTNSIPGPFNDDGTMAGTFLDGSIDINEDIDPENGVPDVLDSFLNGFAAGAPAPS